MVDFPQDRPGDYDPDLVFDEDTGTWVSNADLLRQGGSRYRAQLVVVGAALVYFEPLE